MAIVRDVRVSQDAINKLVRAMLPIMQGNRKTDIEVALIVAYCQVADGVQAYPIETRAARASIVVSRSTRAICEIIEAVGQMPDDDVHLEAMPTHGTCQN